ncbi:MAG TPA: 4-hydroxybenzoate polyprenyltransferase, partial [Pseudonocardiaceae bacterium]
TVRRATVAGIHGMVPLQAALAARAGSPLGALGVLAALPVARALSRKVSPT